MTGMSMKSKNTVRNYTEKVFEEMLTCMPFVLIHMSHFSIDEILEVSGFDEKTKRLQFNEIFRKEDA